MTVRERIVRILEERGMTQTAIAKRMDKRIQWVNSRLTGGTEIKADEVLQFARALDLEVQELFADDEDEVTTDPEALLEADLAWHKSILPSEDDPPQTLLVRALMSSMNRKQLISVIERLTRLLAYHMDNSENRQDEENS